MSDFLYDSSGRKFLKCAQLLEDESFKETINQAQTASQPMQTKKKPVKQSNNVDVWDVPKNSEAK